jgi:SAM-dependent methyltransferase
MKLNYWENSWPLDRDRCPCDLDFLEYLTRCGAHGKSIFHFGSGEHHILGRGNVATAGHNHILAITASRNEHSTYVDLIIRHPEIAQWYKVLFADIYTLTAPLLPSFDFVTLFHLCEYYDPAKSAYAHHDDESLLELFLSRVNPGGRILFYQRSSSFEKALPIIRRAIASGRLVEEEDYKSLYVCQAGPGPSARS